LIPREALPRLREALHRAEYSEDAVHELVGRASVLRDPELVAGELGDAPLGDLVRLFALGVPVPHPRAARALAPAELDELGAAFVPEDDAVRAEVALTPYDGLLFLHDPPRPEQIGADFVTGVNSASKTLASLSVRRETTSALDVGTGCGVQAALAARHADRVVGTDVNGRALQFAELNAALNGLANLEFRRGSLLEPAAGEQFGLVASNPPYVVSPDTAYVFRDSGGSADEISRELVARVPAALEEGGFATLLLNWVVRDPDAPTASVEAWLEGCGCDAWILHYGTQGAPEYAAKWNSEIGTAGGAYAEAVRRWLAYYRAERIERIALGAVVLRRREGANWLRVDSVPLPPAGRAGDQILRVFAARDRPLDDAALLDASVELVSPHRLDQSLLHEGGAYAAQDAALVLEDGVGLRPTVDPHAIHVLFGLEGMRPLRELVSEAAEATGLERDLVAEQTVATIGRLYELGFVVTRA
jgi:SAM-dependent methyltransferase